MLTGGDTQTVVGLIILADPNKADAHQWVGGNNGMLDIELD